MLLRSLRCEEAAAGAASRFVVTAFRRSHDDTTRTQEDRMNAVTTSLSHAVAHIDKELSMTSRKRLTGVRFGGHPYMTEHSRRIRGTHREDRGSGEDVSRARVELLWFLTAVWVSCSIWSSQAQ